MPAYPYVDERAAAVIEGARSRIYGDLDGPLKPVEEAARALKAAVERAVKTGFDSSVTQSWIEDVEIAADEAVEFCPRLRAYADDMDLPTAEAA